jgi:hypothetical protein
MTDEKIEVGETNTDIDGDVLSLLSIPKISVPIIFIVRASHLTY